MTLIDWPGLAHNALWIVGLSTVLAAWSYGAWDARQRRVRLRLALSWPLLQVPIAAGLLLFGVSLSWGAQTLWERVAWAVLAAAFAWQIGAGWRVARASGWRSAAH